jgi:hypothetical protein
MESMESTPNNSGSARTHTYILQTTGLLRSFGIAKMVRSSELRELKRLLKSVASSKKEYNSMLQEEIEKMSRIGGTKSPIPGIVVVLGTEDRNKAVVGSAKASAKKLKQFGWTKDMICFYILALIKELGLSQSDFDDVISSSDDEFDSDDEDEAE